MDQDISKKPKWDIDLRLASLIGENVRVGAEAFVPLNGIGERGHPVSTSTLLLPDGAEPHGPVFVEGRLLSYIRQIGVVTVELEALTFQKEAANGRILFRGTPAVILQAPATVKLSHPFFVERIPADATSYWSHLVEKNSQLSLSFDDGVRLPQAPVGEPFAPQSGAADIDDNATRPPMPLGRTLITGRAKNTLSRQDVLSALFRHAREDWGESFDPEDATNSKAEDRRLVSNHRDSRGQAFRIATETAASSTTVFLTGERSDAEAGLLEDWVCNSGCRNCGG